MSLSRLAALLLVGLAIAGATPAGAQTSGKTYRLGFLVTMAGPGVVAVQAALSRALAARGFATDRNLVIDVRSADGKPKRLVSLAKGLADAGTNVIVTLGYPPAKAAKEGAASVPIVAINGGDPVETGLVASFGHPGGNLTGISDMASVLSVKRLDLLKSAVPSIKKVAMLWNADDLGMTTRYHAAAAAAAGLGIAVQALGVREPDDFGTAFSTMTTERPDGILMVTDVLTVLNRRRVFEFASEHKIPAIYEYDFLAREGGLMSYGPDGDEVTERVADLVVRILKGARPGELPFEQPTRFKFVVNVGTAKALSLELPPTLLARADEVIE